MKLNVNKNMINERSSTPTTPPVPPQPPPFLCYSLLESKRKGIVRVQKKSHSSSKLKRKNVGKMRSSSKLKQKNVGKMRSSSKLKRKNVCKLQKDAVKCKRDMVLMHRDDLSFYHFFESFEPLNEPCSDVLKRKRHIVLMHRNDTSFYHFFESSEPLHAPCVQSFSILLKKVALQDIFTCNVLSSYALSNIRVHFRSKGVSTCLIESISLRVACSNVVKRKRYIVLMHRNDTSFYHFFESSEPLHAPCIQSFSIIPTTLHHSPSELYPSFHFSHPHHHHANITEYDLTLTTCGNVSAMECA